MHSRIFQLSEHPINPDDYIIEEDFYDNFIGEVADYVSGDTCRNEDIYWFVSSLKQYGIIYNEKEESIIFPEDFKFKYFKSRYDKFVKLSQEIDLRKFSSDDLELWSLQQLIENKYGFYIFTNHYEPLDSFVRQLQGEEKYFIGGTIDYHF
jgi:hypothetical protein